MNLSKRHKPVPNHKLTNDSQVNNTVTISYMNPAEMIAKYGAPKCKWRRGYRP